MLRLNEGWDYTLYRIYIVGGLIALIGIPIGAALLFGDRLPYADYGVPYMIGLTGWILGILLYWWWGFLRKDGREFQAGAARPATSTPPNPRT